MAKIFLSVLALCVFQLSAFAQDTVLPSVAYVYPAGGKVGTKVRVFFGGKNFSDASEVIVSGGGVKATIIEHILPKRQGDIPSLMRRLEKEYLKANPEKEKEIKEMGEKGDAYLRKIIRSIPENKEKIEATDKSFYLRLVSTDPFAETVEVELDIAPDAKLGQRDIIIRTKCGLSQPRKFIISNTNEFRKPSLRETAIARTNSKSYKGGARGVYSRKFVDQPFVPMKIELPVIANGQITEGAVDRYVFSAKAGEKIFVSVDAQKLIPYISDAVPGWFQTVVRVFDDKGKEVAYNDDCYFYPDSYLVFRAPKTCEYTLQINDAIYRSREDFVYRLSISKTPLPSHIANFKSMPKPKNAIVFEEGVIAKSTDENRYCVELKKGQKVVAEIFARRLNSPLDSFLYVVNSTGEVLASNDDYYDETDGLTTHHSDSRLEFECARSGKYYFCVRDASKIGSLNHRYILNIAPPKTDFKVLSYKSVSSVHKNGILWFKLKVFRNGNEKYPIKISAKLPKGWQILNPIIPKDVVDYELLVKPTSTNEVHLLKFYATATFDSEKITREVMPCDDMMQAFYYRHFVPAHSFYCSVDEGEKFMRAQSTLECSLDLGIQKVPLKGKLSIKLAKTKQTHQRILPRFESKIVKYVKMYWYKGWMYVEVEPTPEAKVGDKQTLHFDLLFKRGSKLYEFDKSPPITFEIVPEKKSEQPKQKDKKSNKKRKNSSEKK